MVKGPALAGPSERSERFEPVVRRSSRFDSYNSLRAKLRMNLFASIVGMPPNTNANSIILIGGFSVPEPIEANRKAITAMAQLACRNSIANSLYFIMDLFVSS